MEEARGQRLIVTLSGTGIAAGPPIVRRRVAEGDALRTQVLVGVRASAELALQSELDAWRVAGVEATVCLSQGPDEGAPYMARGYIQDVLLARTLPGALLGARVFAVGPVTMIDALRRVGPILGVAAEHVYTNH
jgi:NAD(P)H-flavin reductase